MSNEIVFIEAPSNLGLKSFIAGKEPAVKFFSKTLLDTGFAEKLKITNIMKVEPPAYSTDIDPTTQIRNAHGIKEYSVRLAKKISDNIYDFQLAIGGDCSILIGCGLGLKAKGNYALLFLDGHTDYMLPEQSGTHGAAGMDLALVTGNGPTLLSNINSLAPYFREEDVYCLANRELTDWYVDLIEKSDIHYYDLQKCRQKGWGNLADSFLKMVSDKNLDGFWIHFDVDVLNDEIMPCVDSRQTGGMHYTELKELLSPLLASPMCKGIDITIYDPSLDETKNYIQNFSRELQMLLQENIIKNYVHR